MEFYSFFDNDLKITSYWEFYQSYISEIEGRIFAGGHTSPTREYCLPCAYTGNVASLLLFTLPCKKYLGSYLCLTNEILHLARARRRVHMLTNIIFHAKSNFYV